MRVLVLGLFQGDWFYTNWATDHPDLTDAHINLKETFTVFLALHRWKWYLLDKWIVVHTDNQTTISALNKGISRNPQVMQWLRSGSRQLTIFESPLVTSLQRLTPLPMPSHTFITLHSAERKGTFPHPPSSVRPPTSSGFTVSLLFSPLAGAVHTQEQLLQEELRMYRNHAFAKSTAASYKSQLRAYLRFCLFFGYTPVPCRAIHLLRYIVFLARTLSTRSIPNYLNVVRLLHLQYGYPNPLEDPLFKHQKTLLMRGIKRINGERVTQKLPITPDVLHKMQCHLHLDSLFDATFWAACLVAFFSFFRKSNLLPPSTTEFDTKRHLRKCDVRLFPWGIILVVRWSKTIQYRDRTLLVPVPKIAHSSLCPWSAVTRAFKLAGVYQSNKSASEPAFTYLEDGVLKTLTYTTFTTKLKRILDLCGYDSSRFSGHSFRQGGASFALHCGVPSDYIKLQGDWKSTEYKRYLDHSLRYKLEAVKQMIQGITH